jgi:DNA-binding CsgD family transcriptional regulator
MTKTDTKERPNTKERVTGKVDSNKTLIKELLRKRAKDRSESLRWNGYTLMLAYVILASTVILALRDVNGVVVSAVGILGLGAIWAFSRVQAKKVEQSSFQEEMRNYESLLSGHQHPGQATPNQEESVESPLTDRELQVLRQIAAGRTNRQTATVLNISEQTVKNHISHIFAKLDVADRTSAVMLALRNGWISGHDADESRVEKS